MDIQGRENWDKRTASIFRVEVCGRWVIVLWQLFPMFLLPLKIENLISPKCWCLYIQLHGMTSQKAVISAQHGVLFIYGFHCTTNKPIQQYLHKKCTLKHYYSRWFKQSEEWWNWHRKDLPWLHIFKHRNCWTAPIFWRLIVQELYGKRYPSYTEWIHPNLKSMTFL
jgi:hypothetical protein